MNYKSRATLESPAHGLKGTGLVLTKVIAKHGFSKNTNTAGVDLDSIEPDEGACPTVEDQEKIEKNTAIVRAQKIKDEARRIFGADFWRGFDFDKRYRDLFLKQFAQTYSAQEPHPSEEERMRNKQDTTTTVASCNAQEPQPGPSGVTRKMKDMTATTTHASEILATENLDTAAAVEQIHFLFVNAMYMMTLNDDRSVNECVEKFVNILIAQARAREFKRNGSLDSSEFTDQDTKLECMHSVIKKMIHDLYEKHGIAEMWKERRRMGDKILSIVKESVVILGGFMDQNSYHFGELWRFSKVRDVPTFERLSELTLYSKLYPSGDSSDADDDSL